MKVYIEREKSEQELFFKGKVIDLLHKLGINPDDVLVVRKGELITEDEVLNDDDEVKLLSVISGG
jgi:sulfur carrier protein ThiS